MAYIIRTLTDPDRGVFGPFDPDHFCQTASDGSPMHSMHTLFIPDGLWIGHVFRDFQDEPWQIAIAGSLDVRGAWDDFEVAISHLMAWREEVAAETDRWRSLYGLPSLRTHQLTLPV